MDDRARPPNPSALPCGDAAVSRHVPAATLAQAMALVRGSKAAAPAEEALTAAGGSKAVAAWMQDYSATVERLELMVLQAQQMQMEVLEVRAQAAILQNRTTLLNNGIEKIEIASQPADSTSRSGTQAGSLAAAAAPDLGHLSAPVAVTIRPIRPRSTPTAGSRPTPLLTKRLSGGVSDRSGTQPAAPAAPSPGPVSQQAALAAPGTRAGAALNSPPVSLVGKALQQASPNSTSSGSKGTH
ncbi:hypothetical protein HaLaN_19043 [Haematococcus lacustris]|uniref:Uncharacterized protein n=2 Tax=Haematococcus lacustris TaxID=44745 RepID=A0A699ZTR7_HAELA|nr:hypothetical protein HaLaN_19043 [Haematococcus lacustris]